LVFGFVHVCFFFSSRRRHTRSYGDWSSDVCSSDLTDRRVAAGALAGLGLALLHPAYTYAHHHTPSLLLAATHPGVPGIAALTTRSEERRVGKEWRARWAPYHEKKERKKIMQLLWE